MQDISSISSEICVCKQFILVYVLIVGILDVGISLCTWVNNMHGQEREENQEGGTLEMIRNL